MKALSSVRGYHKARLSPLKLLPGLAKYDRKRIYELNGVRTSDTRLVTRKR